MDQNEQGCIVVLNHFQCSCNICFWFKINLIVGLDFLCATGILINNVLYIPSVNVAAQEMYE